MEIPDKMVFEQLLRKLLGLNASQTRRQLGSHAYRDFLSCIISTMSLLKNPQSISEHVEFFLWTTFPNYRHPNFPESVTLQQWFREFKKLSPEKISRAVFRFFWEIESPREAKKIQNLRQRALKILFVDPENVEVEILYQKAKLLGLL